MFAAGKRTHLPGTLTASLCHRHVITMSPARTTSAMAMGSWPVEPVFIQIAADFDTAL